MVIPGVVGLREDFKALMRECLVGFVVCSAMVIRIFLFTLARGKYEQNYELKVLYTFNVQYAAVSFYKI